MLGYVVISILVGLLFEVYDVIAEKRTLRRKRARFGPFFGEYYAPEKRDEWARLKTRLKLGDVVRGVVVHKGWPLVSVDIGCGFPATFSIDDVPSERKKSAGNSRKALGPLLPEPGGELEARVKDFLDAYSEIELTQRGRWLLFDGEVIGFLAYAEHLPRAENSIEGRYYLRSAENEAHAAFRELPKSEETVHCEVLSGDETRRVNVKRRSRGYVEVGLPEETSPLQRR